MQRTKVGQVYSSWEKIKSDNPQDSMLGPIFFNIDLFDLLFITKSFDIVSFADDNTPHMPVNHITNLVEDLEGSIFK